MNNNFVGFLFKDYELSIITTEGITRRQKLKNLVSDDDFKVVMWVLGVALYKYMYDNGSMEIPSEGEE